MNAFVRLTKFSLVGAMGTAFQLGALALLSHWMPGHYLYATAAAIELTLLHNFLWHCRYTWRDRQGTQQTHRFLRFHISNGLVSLLGNLVLMRLLVGEAHLPVMVSNAIAVLSCSIPNFLLGNSWVFATPLFLIKSS
jgi:putative flippase GtrA